MEKASERTIELVDEALLGKEGHVPHAHSSTHHVHLQRLPVVSGLTSNDADDAEQPCSMQVWLHVVTPGTVLLLHAAGRSFVLCQLELHALGQCNWDSQ